MECPECDGLIVKDHPTQKMWHHVSNGSVFCDEYQESDLIADHLSNLREGIVDCCGPKCPICFGDESELSQLLKNMDIPELRRNDIPWLTRNLPFKNSTHPDFARAWELLGNMINNIS